MIATLYFAAVAAFGSWNITPAALPGSTQKFDVTVDATMGGSSHAAKFKLVTVFSKLDASSHMTASSNWQDVLVDDQGQDDPPTWKLRFGAQGDVQAALEDLGDEYRRMLAPMYFVYPQQAVSTGDKWKVTSGPEKRPTSLAFEVMGLEKVKDADAVKISEKISEDKEGLSGDGTWWVSPEGKVLKFELKLHNWVVPFAGSDPVDATIKAAAP